MKRALAFLASAFAFLASAFLGFFIWVVFFTRAISWESQLYWPPDFDYPIVYAPILGYAVYLVISRRKSTWWRMGYLLAFLAPFLTILFLWSIFRAMLPGGECFPLF